MAVPLSPRTWPCRRRSAGAPRTSPASPGSCHRPGRRRRGALRRPAVRRPRRDRGSPRRWRSGGGAARTTGHGRRPETARAFCSSHCPRRSTRPAPRGRGRDRGADPPEPRGIRRGGMTPVRLSAPAAAGGPHRGTDNLPGPLAEYWPNADVGKLRSAAHAWHAAAGAVQDVDGKLNATMNGLTTAAGSDSHAIQAFWGRL